MRTSFSFTSASRTKLGAVILAAVLGVLAVGQISASMANTIPNSGARAGI